MPDLKTQFDTAVAESKNLTERPNNTTLLTLYSLYKQASIGDNLEAKPGFTDVVGRAKWDAWIAQKGTPAEVAMQRYIDLIATLN